MPVASTDAATLAREAACYCYTPEQACAVLIYLLRQNASVTDTPAELAVKAACYCYGEKRTQENVINYLLTLLT